MRTGITFTFPSAREHELLPDFGEFGKQDAVFFVEGKI